MANNCSTDHNCKFDNHIVLMFQHINVAKSAPFALLTIYQKSMYPPQSSLKCPISANYAKFAKHFPIHPVENDIPQIYSECSEICSIHPLLVRITQNPCNPHQFHTLLNNSCPTVQIRELREITAIRTNFN